MIIPVYFTKMISIIILSIVLILIAVRQIGKIKLQIWQIMSIGALAALLTGQINLSAAFKAIDFDVIIFLFGMFVIGQAIEESGYLSHFSYQLYNRAVSLDLLLLIILFTMGIASAFLMNDTVAIIGTPVILLIAKKNNIRPKILLLALAFSVTIGSVMSPIGNPQNLIIAINGGLSNSFSEFLKALFIPTIVNLFIAFAVLRLYYKDDFRKKLLNHPKKPIKDKVLASLSKVSLLVMLILVVVKIIFSVLSLSVDFRLTYIAVGAALPIILFSKKRVSIIKNIDWSTLIFFVSMFILMQSVWNSGIFQYEINNHNIQLNSTDMILTVSVTLSQLISNVPLVALYLPLLLKLGAGAKEMMALAAGSTIAGNLFILGAASNIIIIQNAEKRTGDTLTFLDFARIGIPLTILNLLVYYFYLQYFFK